MFLVLPQALVFVGFRLAGYYLGQIDQDGRTAAAVISTGALGLSLVAMLMWAFVDDGHGSNYQEMLNRWEVDRRDEKRLAEKRAQAIDEAVGIPRLK